MRGVTERAYGTVVVGTESFLSAVACAGAAGSEELRCLAVIGSPVVVHTTG